MHRKIWLIVLFVLLLVTVTACGLPERLDGTIVLIGDNNRTFLLKETSLEEMRGERKADNIAYVYQLTASVRNEEDTVQRKEDLKPEQSAEVSGVVIYDIGELTVHEKVLETLTNQCLKLKTFVSDEFHPKEEYLCDWILSAIEGWEADLANGYIGRVLPWSATLRIEDLTYTDENRNVIKEGHIRSYIYKAPNRDLNYTLGQEMDLAEKNLSSSLFWCTDMARTSFAESVLRHTLFTESILTNVNFRDTDLSCTFFGETDCRDADFTNADFQGAVFCGDDLTGAVFDEANFNGVSFANDYGKKTKIDRGWKNYILSFDIIGPEYIEWVE